MTVPMVLLLAQLGLWYQSAPLPVGEETVVTVKLGGEVGTPMPAVELVPGDAIEDLSGPVRVTSQREVCWSIRTRQPGYLALYLQGRALTGQAMAQLVPLYQNAGKGFVGEQLRRAAERAPCN